jgi:V/A-type H+-transporting ATPase subunit D
MAKKIKLTRPELKRQRDMLSRFARYLPLLKLKQQQLQLTLREVQRKRREVLAAAEESRAQIRPYEAVLADVAGVNFRELSKPDKIETTDTNIAGVSIPVFHHVAFPVAVYSLFATPPWVDRAVADHRVLNRHLAEAEVLQKQYDLLNRELTKIVQRVNLFEKVKIPQCREFIRIIRIKLGDEMTAAVGRAKIAKTKLAESERDEGGRDAPIHPDDADSGIQEAQGQ